MNTPPRPANPNRPTPAGYCASCTRTPCMYRELPSPCPAYCWPGPRTEFNEWIQTVNQIQRDHPDAGFFPGMDCNEIGAMVARLYSYSLDLPAADPTPTAPGRDPRHGPPPNRDPR